MKTYDKQFPIKEIIEDIIYYFNKGKFNHYNETTIDKACSFENLNEFLYDVNVYRLIEEKLKEYSIDNLNSLDMTERHLDIILETDLFNNIYKFKDDKYSPVIDPRGISPDNFINMLKAYKDRCIQELSLVLYNHQMLPNVRLEFVSYTSHKNETTNMYACGFRYYYDDSDNDKEPIYFLIDV